MNLDQILIVEDDEPLSRLLRVSLEVIGYSTFVAHSRDEALERMSNELPKLIVMDHLMRGIGPEVFISKARAQGFSGPILLCTGLDEHSGLDVDDTLMKPFEPAELEERIRQLLKQ